MPEPVRIAMIGVGRMGPIHALHVHELEQEAGECKLTAIVDPYLERARSQAAELGSAAQVFSSIEAMLNAHAADASIVATPTELHLQHTMALMQAGQRVLLEKPLTGTLEGDKIFADRLDREAPEGLMLAFQRRFDPPLQYAKGLLDEGVIGRVFKICSALEDSVPAPNGYKSVGILPDMSIHNVDEAMWLTGQMPSRALSIGARIYSHRLTTAEEDFDDALVYLWFEGGLIGQLGVSRNHVSGYRVETAIYGEQGQLLIGRFDQKPLEVVVEAFGIRCEKDSIARKVFPMRDYQRTLPEFVNRFGSAYKAEVAQFVECCRSNSAFPVTHRDGLRAQQVIAAAMGCVIGPEQAGKIETA